MPFEDMALYRAIPGATIFDITDVAMLEDILRQCKDINGVKYIRVGRKNNKKMYEKGSSFTVGKAITVKEEGRDCTIIACGIMVAKAMEAAEILKKDGIGVTVVDMFTIKPVDEEMVLKVAEQTGAIVTAENHNKIGGLYSAVVEVLANREPVPVEYVAVEDEYGEVGPQDYLEERFGLTAEHIVKKVKKVIERKK